MSTNSWAAYDVHLGTWTDWSRGKVLGATVTLTRQDSGLLIAFLVFYVALVGTRFWRILCPVLRWTFSKNGPADGVHHQRQAFLRNSPNPESAVGTLTGMCFSWRKNSQRIWSRVLWLIALSLASFVGFILAGGCSPRVTTLVSGEVLLSGANCAFVGNSSNMSTWGVTVGPMRSQAVTAAESYARQCYTSTSVPGSAGCSSSYVRRHIPPAIVDTNASCPFDPKICKTPSGNLLIDTGLLDSFDDFGRNTPATQRLKFRRTLHCAPLTTYGYRFHSFDEAKNQSYTTYHYGPLRNADKSVTANHTARFSSNSYIDTGDLLQGAGDTTHDFMLRLHYAIFLEQRQHSVSTFTPIPELVPRNSSGEVFILFLQSDNVLFLQKPKDRWYGDDMGSIQVHDLLKGFGNGTENVSMFRQNQPGSPLACHELQQYCYTGAKGTQKCTQLQGGIDAVGNIFAQLDPEDEPWFNWFELTTVETGMATRSPLNLLGARMLMARDSLNGPILGQLPDNQWQLEVQHWHATAMADMQAAFLRSIVGPGNPDLPRLMRVVYPNSTVEREICKNQKVVVEGFVSFKIFTIVCIFVGGLLIIVLSFTLDSMVSRCLRLRGERAQYSRLDWSTNETLQIQRLAHEAAGAGT
ncbi:hypothetical protein B0T18DRAFT_491030 [Schizothecium vesticola]|uniref:Uncharacterized protein n=1 Tax=Schizothecium vesticola TaxID=314040 RepID=A0AA40EJE0_9PEZI|nr:hypothetical protein B0T18DRAFT_491030 [Schizothecium vesticola]